MNKHAFHILVLLISLAAFAVAAHAQSSLDFSDRAGRIVKFTNFGTIDYPDQNTGSRGYEVVYNDGSGVKRAWFLNNLNNFGIIPDSLSADQPNGHRLSAGQAVYIRARVRTADNKLEITFRYTLMEGPAGTEAVVTIENKSNARIDIIEMSILSPPSTQAVERPCDPVREFDGATLQSFLVTVAPNVIYRKTKAVFRLSMLNSSESRDLPGCDPKQPPIPIFPIR